MGPGDLPARKMLLLVAALALGAYMGRRSWINGLAYYSCATHLQALSSVCIFCRLRTWRTIRFAPFGPVLLILVHLIPFSGHSRSLWPLTQLIHRNRDTLRVSGS